MIEPTTQPNDAFRIEGQAEDLKTKFNLDVKGFSLSGQAQAKTIKLVVVGVCILSALCTGLAGYIGYIFTVG